MNMTLFTDSVAAWKIVPRLGVFRRMRDLLATFILLSSVLLMSTIILAFSLSFQQWADDWQVGISGQLSLVISPNIDDEKVVYSLKDQKYQIHDPMLSDHLDALVTELKQLPEIYSASWLPLQELEKLLIPEQTLGQTRLWEEMGLPLYIELKVVENTPDLMVNIQKILFRYNEKAVIDDHGNWTNEVVSSANNISLLLLGFNGLVVMTLMLCCYMITQSDLLKSRQTVEVLGLMGSPVLVIIMIMVRRILRVVLYSMLLSIVLFLLFWLALSFAFQQEMAYFNLSWQVVLGLLTQYTALLLMSVVTVVFSCRNYLSRD